MKVTRFKESDIPQIYLLVTKKHIENIDKLQKYRKRYPLFGVYKDARLILSAKIELPNQYKNNIEYLHALYKEKQFNDTFKILLFKFIAGQISNIQRRKAPQKVEMYKLAEVPRLYKLSQETDNIDILTDIRERFPLHPAFQNREKMRIYATNDVVVPDDFIGSHRKESYRNHLYIQAKNNGNIEKDLAAMAYYYVCNKFTTLRKKT